MLLSFEDDGPGPVVVLLHGFPFDHTMWSHQLSHVGSIYRVIALDLRGHGSSAAPQGVYSVDDLADDVVETLDALQLTAPVSLGGLSLGGYVALSIADRYPDRLNALMLLNTRSSADIDEVAAHRRALADAVEQTGDVEPVVAGMLPRLFGARFRQEHPDAISKIHARMSRTTPRAVAGTLRGMADRPDRTDVLARLRIPTLIVSGAEDQIIPSAEVAAMVAACPSAHHVSVPDAGHMTPVESPEAVNRILLDFLQTLW